MGMEAAGAYLRTLRERQGISQQFIAQRINKSQKTVERWERGENEPGLSDLQSYLDEVGGSVVMLVWLLLNENAKAADGIRATTYDLDNMSLEEQINLLKLRPERRRLVMDLVHQLL